jgi:hypothetical protein
MRWPELKSPVARAVAPVLAGIAFFAVLGLALWGVAAYMSGDDEEVRLAPSTYQIGTTKTMARIIAEDGPLILPDLLQASGERSIVLDHTGNDPQRGWRIFMAYPADRDVDCKVEQVKRTRTFTDCESRTLAIDALALPPAGVQPNVSADGDLELDLRPDSGDPAATTTAPSG